VHIPDGVVSGEVNAATLLVSAGVCAVALAKARRNLEERQVPLLGVTAAFIFAAQMVNFPVAGGTSGHFLGAALAAILLKPLNACLVMAIVLVTQCLGFNDGGITALGSNLFNMGVVGGLVSYAVFRGVLWVLPRRRESVLAAAAVASWLSVTLCAACCAVELGISGTSPLRVALPAMSGVYAVVGVGEAIITGAILSSVMAVRPDLIGAYVRVPVPEAQGA
jgi:cobalt/nickel transport system permease protein